LPTRATSRRTIAAAFAITVDPDNPALKARIARVNELRAAGRDTVVEGATSDEFPTPARRPAYSVLASEFDDTPALPPWEAGVEACMRGCTA